MSKMQRIHIENFKAIKLADIEIKKTVLLIGDNASGKSTIAKLVYFFKSIKDDYLDVISENLETLDSDDTLWKLFIYAIRKKFYRSFGAIQHLPKSFEIQYFYTEKKILTLSVVHTEQGRKSLKVEFSKDTFYKKVKEEVFPLVNRIREINNKRAIFGSSIYRTALEELNNYTEKLFENEKMQLAFIPAGRSVAVSYPDFFRMNFAGSLSSDLARLKDDENAFSRFSENTYTMLEFVKKVEALRDTFKGESFDSIIEKLDDENKKSNATVAKNKIAEILKGNYKFDGFSDEQIFFNDTEYVHLINASSGQQEVIRILQDLFLIIVNGERAFRVIEEPEVHLFPTAQKRLLETIALMLNVTESQIFITTHSPYVLSVFTNLLFASQVAEYGIDGDEPISVMYQLKSAETAVYFLANGLSSSIIDKETQLIDQNVLDEISEELAGEFDFLYSKLMAKGG